MYLKVHDSKFKENESLINLKFILNEVFFYQEKHFILVIKHIFIKLFIINYP